jgi:hypothetical protein
VVIVSRARAKPVRRGDASSRMSGFLLYSPQQQRFIGDGLKSLLGIEQVHRQRPPVINPRNHSRGQWTTVHIQARKATPAH